MSGLHRGLYADSVCAICGKRVAPRPGAKISHARKHVREGTAREFRKLESPGGFRTHFEVLSNTESGTQIPKSRVGPPPEGAPPA